MRNYIKPFIALLSMAVCLTACYDEENVNIGNTTVQFKEATMQVSEATTSLNIPIVVEGAHHSTVKVHVEYTEAFGLKDDENVIITSRDLLIPVDVSEVQLETRLSVSNEEIENGRVLSFTITGVEGANLGSNTTCEVNLRESSPIEGSYELTGLALHAGNIISSMSCTFILSEDDPNILELDFGFGNVVEVPMVPANIDGDYEITIPADGDLGNGLAITYYDGQYIYSNDISGYFDHETYTITIPMLVSNLGLAFYNPSEMVLYYAFMPYEENGEVVPVQFIKRR